MGRWATKNQPKDKGRYFITYKNSIGRYVADITDRAQNQNGVWYWSLAHAHEYGLLPDSAVIAWQKAPEPYIPE